MSIPTLPLGKVTGAAALGRLEILKTVQKSQIALLAPHQDRTKQGRRCQSRHLVLQPPLGRFTVGVACRTSLAHLSWGILDT